MAAQTESNTVVELHGKRIPVYYDEIIGMWRWGRYEGDKFPSHGYGTKAEALRMAVIYTTPLK